MRTITSMRENSTLAFERKLFYNFALDVVPASTSAYISSITSLYFFAVWGRLSFSLDIKSVKRNLHCKSQTIGEEKLT